MRRARFVSGIAALAFLAIVTPAFAVIIDDIQGNLGSTRWYYGNGDYFQTNYISGSAPAEVDTFGFSTVNSSASEYWLFGGTFSIEQSALIQDLTSVNGGLAKGIFAAGATLTIGGELYNDAFTDLVAEGDLIVADIMYQWELEEMGSPYPSNTVRGHAFFHVTGGALSSGELNSDGLVLNDFVLNFTFQSSSPNVTDFGTTTATYTNGGPAVQIGSIPEPASIALMGLGALAILRRRKT